MFGSSVIDVAIGIIFVFLLMSLIASTMNELILAYLNLRGKELLRGIQTLLNDGDAKALLLQPDGLVKEIFNHGLVYGLFQGEFEGKNKAGDLPSYIPARNFALALLDTIPKKAAVEHLRKAIDALGSDEARKALNSELPPKSDASANQNGQSNGAAKPKQAALGKPATEVIGRIRDAAGTLLNSVTDENHKAEIENVISIAEVALGESLPPELTAKLSSIADEARRIGGTTGTALAAMANGATPSNIQDLLAKMEDAAKKLNESAPDLGLLVDAAKSEANPVQALRRAAMSIDTKVGQPLVAMIKETGGDVTKLIAEVESWYNSAMDRVSGWYKFHTQKLLFVLGLLLAVAVNANTITIVQALSKNATLRQSVVAAAQQYVSDKNATSGGNSAAGFDSAAQTTSTPANAPGMDEQIQAVHDHVNKLEGLGLPLGWSDTWHPKLKVGPNEGYPSWVVAWLGVLAGWLITAFAVSLGAPFWFDMLNKIMVVRSTVKPREKSPEEKSKS